jgi:hypothetical protein
MNTLAENSEAAIRSKAHTHLADTLRLLAAGALDDAPP